MLDTRDEATAVFAADAAARLCGVRHERVAERTAFRHGRQPGYVTLAGQKVGLDKPRVRNRTSVPNDEVIVIEDDLQDS